MAPSIAATLRTQATTEMKFDNPARHFIFAFAIALLGYIVVYHLIEHRRTRNGPWQITFTNAPGGAPQIVINQATLGITNIQIQFPRLSVDTNQLASIASITDYEATTTNYGAPVTFRFSQPKPVPYDVPFGKCVFMDTTFLPGTLTFQFFGHEIELLPRVLILDRTEHPWRSGEVITMKPVERRPSEGRP